MSSWPCWQSLANHWDYQTFYKRKQLSLRSLSLACRSILLYVDVQRIRVELASRGYLAGQEEVEEVAEAGNLRQRQTTAKRKLLPNTRSSQLELNLTQNAAGWFVHNRCVVFGLVWSMLQPACNCCCCYSSSHKCNNNNNNNNGKIVTTDWAMQKTWLTTFFRWRS